MFLDTIISGIRTLTYWEVYAATVEYLLIYMIPMFIFGSILDRGNDGFQVLFGCLSMFILAFFQISATIIFILTLSPIILGISEDAAWSFPWIVIYLVPGEFLKWAGILVVANIVLTFIPIFGKWNSFQTLILGGISLVSVVGFIDSISPDICCRGNRLHSLIVVLRWFDCCRWLNVLDRNDGHYVVVKCSR